LAGGSIITSLLERRGVSFDKHIVTAIPILTADSTGNVRVRNAIVNLDVSDGNSDTNDLDDFLVILNYSDRW
jgi:hypothetical protein